MADNPKKRRQPADSGCNPKRARFPPKPQHHIAATPTKNAYPHGEVNVKTFLASHENEIRSLEHAMRTAKKGLSRRAFQDVPRELRRRTASHNPQRVPKRLRARSKQEAKEDNTPISRGTSGSGIGKGKKKSLRKEGREESRKSWQERAAKRKATTNASASTVLGDAAEAGDTDGTRAVLNINPRQKSTRKFPALATPATPPSRFRRRQQDKTWLPTHVWHTKRARITDPKDPLWRFAIPLQPAAKAYRLTHRAATQRGAVAWDKSYVSTIGLEGVEPSITGLLKGLHFASECAETPWQDGGKAKKWRHGTRAWQGWICEREARPPKKIAQVTVIWCVSETDRHKRQAFVRVHPGAFLQLWEEIVGSAKVQKPAVAVRDLRFEIGSVEVMGPAAAEALNSVLSPTSSANTVSESPQSVWAALAAVTDPTCLPPGAVLGFTISDPRFQDPPRATTLSHDQESMGTMLNLLATWPLDYTQTACPIYDKDARLKATRSMPSQKSINRRRSACTLGECPEARPNDPEIPVLIHTSRESRSWTLLLPWKCVMPVWRGIMRYPVSTGGNPRFGGLKERRQVDFERSVPCFPYDHPGTDAGWSWELRERVARKREWTKRPKGKRIEWTTIDLGNGRKGEVGDPWACEWERLLTFHDGSNNVRMESAPLTSPFQQHTPSQVKQWIERPCPAIKDREHLYLFTAKISMVQQGTPTDCARIYRLPRNDSELREKWLSLMTQPEPSPRHASRKQQTPKTSMLPITVSRKQLARSLLDDTGLHNGRAKAGEDDYPIVPDEADLIGFVTTGNYNLAEGKPTAVANLALHRVVGGGQSTAGLPAEERVCIVRQAGSTVGRLARWEVV